MDAKKTVIFVVVGGVGVYLTYKYLEDQGYLLKWFPSTFGPPTKTPAPGAGAGSGAAGSNPPPAGGGGEKVPLSPPPPKQPAPPAPPLSSPGSASSPASLAAQERAAARDRLYTDLLAAGVPAQVATDFTSAKNFETGAIDPAFQEHMFRLAAIGDPGYLKLTDVGGVLFNADQWEWYRREGGGSDVDPGEVFLDRAAPIHASEFNAALSQFAAGGGMSGLGYVPARLAWVM